MKYLILGNGPASIHAIQSIRKQDANGSITLVTPEELPAYSPCLLADLLANRVGLESLYFIEPGFYTNHNVQTLVNEKAVRILPEEKKVITNSEKELSYDRLFVGIGADPLIPKIPGAHLSNVFPMKSLKDVKNIQKALPHVDSTIVIGAGFIGLEVAQALKENGKNVTVVELLDRVLPLMLDNEMSQPVHDLLVKHDINVLLGQKVESINGQNAVKSVTIGGREYPCDMVVLATGVHPRSDIARQANLHVETGIIVDNHMRTSDPNIYAAGDIVETEDIFGDQRILANWPNATNGGKIAGLNMTGAQVTGSGLEALNVVKVFDTPICSIGNIQPEETLTIKKDGVWKKYHLSNNRITGMQWIGTVERAGVILSLIKKRHNVSELLPVIAQDHLTYGHLMPEAGAPTIFPVGIT